ncbi:DUF6789 family protein [Halomarina ordinaria]|uniref:DUF6789 family protein n=1 Tax=Halomarina ordinaria TaxID=3033939 RepID=A0ABD5U5E3_9EURY|nr:DUF6789 family protein [Halomarina sp. PSRA2]
MDPIRSTIGGGIAATAVLLTLLLTLDAVLPGAEPLVFATFTGLCSIGGPPYCALASGTAFALTLLVFVALFAFAWPLLFAGFTWGLPGESGATHGLVFSFVLWLGYAAGVWIAVWRGWETLAQDVPLLAVTLFAYLVYGFVLGSGYDYLAGHRTFLDQGSAA